MQRYRCRLLSVPATPSALKGNYSYAVSLKRKKKKKKRKNIAAVFGVDYSAHTVALLQSTDRRKVHVCLLFLVFTGAVGAVFSLCSGARWRTHRLAGSPGGLPRGAAARPLGP